MPHGVRPLAGREPAGRHPPVLPRAHRSAPASARPRAARQQKRVGTPPVAPDGHDGRRGTRRPAHRPARPRRTGAGQKNKSTHRTEHRCCPHAVPGRSLPKKDTHKRATPPRRAPTRTPGTAVCKPNFAARGTPDIFGFQPADPAGWEASVPSEPRRTN